MSKERNLRGDDLAGRTDRAQRIQREEREPVQKEPQPATKEPQPTAKEAQPAPEEQMARAAATVHDDEHEIADEKAAPTDDDPSAVPDAGPGFSRTTGIDDEGRLVQRHTASDGTTDYTLEQRGGLTEDGLDVEFAARQHVGDHDVSRVAAGVHTDDDGSGAHAETGVGAAPHRAEAGIGAEDGGLTAGARVTTSLAGHTASSVDAEGHMDADPRDGDVE